MRRCEQPPGGHCPLQFLESNIPIPSWPSWLLLQGSLSIGKKDQKAFIIHKKDRLISHLSLLLFLKELTDLFEEMPKVSQIGL